MTSELHQIIIKLQKVHTGFRVIIFVGANEINVIYKHISRD